MVGDRTQLRSGWLGNWWNASGRVADEISSDEQTKAQQEPGFASKIWNRVPSLWTTQNDIHIADDAHYAQLTKAQIEFLELQSLRAIKTPGNSATWCWFENLSNFENGGSSAGVLSVHGTGSQRRPLPLTKYPIDDANTSLNFIQLRNSVIIPSQTPLDTLHLLPTSTKINIALRDYYNFPNERHLYLRKQFWPEQRIKGRRIVVISMTGNLPEKYERATLESQKDARYLTMKISRSLKQENPTEILGLSMACGLDTKDSTAVFEECVDLLQNWRHIFASVDMILFTGVYHTVPLVIRFSHYLLSHHEQFNFSKDVEVGLLGLESCLQGYRHWDHSSDFLSTTSGSTASMNDLEEDQNKWQLNKEKQLLLGLTRQEQDKLGLIRRFSDGNSEQSLKLKQSLDWLLYNWDGFRMTLFGKVYDNFMTASEKLGVKYQHPKILRHLWCDGEYLEIDTKEPKDIKLPEVSLKTLKFEANIQIPEERLFEVTFISNLLILINLGYQEFIPLFTMVSPFFISRSFNRNTVSSSIRKQQNVDLKIWLQKLDPKLKDFNTILQIGCEAEDHLPNDISNLHNFLKFAHFHNISNSEVLKIRKSIYDDDLVYQCFIENTVSTRSMLTKKHLHVFNDENPKSIWNTVNQYDLVWKLHESLSELVHIKNIPIQEFPMKAAFALSADDTYWKKTFPDQTNFIRDNTSALLRLNQMLCTYKQWDPPTTGLKKLKQILSVLAPYEHVDALIKDLKRLE